MSLQIAGALTVRQPWAWAIVRGLKDVENRSWKPPRKVMGAYIAIHAGSAVWTEEDIAEVEQLSGVKPPELLSFGGIIGLARVANYFQPYSGREESPWYEGGEAYGWQLADTFELPEPIACKGALNIWHPPAGVLADVVRQYASRDAQLRQGTAPLP